jgi:beta-lactamase class A
MAHAPLTSVTESSPALEADVRRLAEPGLGTHGEIGVVAWRLDAKGPRLRVNAANPFPMASTIKVAVACTVLKKIDDSQVKLDQMISIAPSMIVESDLIGDRLIHPGVSLSVYNLLELSLTASDDTATDALIAVAGGTHAVTAWLRSQGIQDQRIDRTVAEAYRDLFHLPPGPLSETLAAARKADPKLDERDNPTFDDDPRDTSTPEAMGHLLTRIFNGQALSPASTKVLTEIMARNRTGDHRIRGRLPLGTPVADKTGTGSGSVNDVGVITLPKDAGKVMMVVFISKSDAPIDARERAIAEIARSVRDYYLFVCSP